MSLNQNISHSTVTAEMTSWATSHKGIGPGAELIGPWLGDKVNSSIGLSYRPASPCSLAGRYDNPMPELSYWLAGPCGLVRQPYARVDFISGIGLSYQLACPCSLAGWYHMLELTLSPRSQDLWIRLQIKCVSLGFTVIRWFYGIFKNNDCTGGRDHSWSNI